jgi:hypothetical protein
MTTSERVAVLDGSFADADRARGALNALISQEALGAGDLQVAFHGTTDGYLLVVAARTAAAAHRARQVLREHGAKPPEQASSSRHSEVRRPVADVGAPSNRAVEREPGAQWLATSALLLEGGVLRPSDLLSLLVTSNRQSGDLPPQERRRRLGAIDAELREVRERLEAELRARHPELFDRRGRLRRGELSRRLVERVGGERVLSGDELFALEEDADADPARAVRAP